MGHEHEAGPAWAAWVEHSWLGEALRSSLWLYPAVETLHIMGFAVLVGAIVAFDARVVARPATLQLIPWQQDVLPVARTGFFLAVPMGLLLFTAEAGSYARNPAFQLKLALLAIALADIALFHALARRSGGHVTPGLRVAAALSLVLWLAVLACGRLIAYV